MAAGSNIEDENKDQDAFVVTTDDNDDGGDPPYPPSPYLVAAHRLEVEAMTMKSQRW